MSEKAALSKRQNSNWYHMLLQKGFVEYFSGTGIDPGDEIYIAFKKVIEGITLGNIIAEMETGKKKEALEIYTHNSKQSEIEEFLRCTNLKKVDFAGIFQTANEMPLCLLSAEQIAVRILYHFCFRMGFSDEKEFAQSGELGRCLKALEEKSK